MRPLPREISRLLQQFSLRRCKLLLGHPSLAAGTVFLSVRPLHAPCRKLGGDLPDPLPELSHTQIIPFTIRRHYHHIVPAAIAVIRLKHRPVGQTVCRASEIYPFILNDMFHFHFFPRKVVSIIFHVLLRFVSLISQGLFGLVSFPLPCFLPYALGSPACCHELAPRNGHLIQGGRYGLYMPTNPQTLYPIPLMFGKDPQHNPCKKCGQGSSGP